MQFLQLPATDIPADSVLLNNISGKVGDFIHMPWKDKADVLLSGLMDVGLKLIAAIAVFIVLRWLIKRMDRLIDRIFVRRHIDSSLGTFIRSMLKIVAYLILILVTISILGIKTTSFVAVLASAAFAVGMALSGTLQNFAGGIMILLLKPFRAGDYIQAQGMEGTVKEIRLFSTILITVDNKTIILPNGGLSSSIVNNFSDAGTRMAEWNLTISYGDNYDTAKKVLEELLRQDARVLQQPPFFIAVKSLDTNVKILVRAWAKSSDMWDIFYDMNEKVYKVFPQHDLRLQSGDIYVNVREKVVEQRSCPSDDDIRDSVSCVKCDNRIKFADNTITRDDIDYPKDAPEDIAPKDTDTPKIAKK